MRLRVRLGWGRWVGRGLVRFGFGRRCSLAAMNAAHRLGRRSCLGLGLVRVVPAMWVRLGGVGSLSSWGLVGSEG